MARGKAKNGEAKSVNGNGAHLGFEAQLFLAAEHGPGEHYLGGATGGVGGDLRPGDRVVCGTCRLASARPGSGVARL